MLASSPPRFASRRPDPPQFPQQFTPRQRAVLPGAGLDRWIRPLKWLLPLAAALAIAAALAMTLAARQEFSFLLSKDKVAASRDRLRIERATYRGADTKGRAFSVTADQAVQRSSATPIVEMRGLTAEMALADGPARITAGSGLYDIEHDRLTLNGPVDAVQGNYRLDTGRVLLDVKTQKVVSDGPVAGRSRLGSFTAPHLEADVVGQRILLTGGARLHIARRTAK